MTRTVAGLILVALLWSGATEAAVSPELQTQIRENTFEVVLKKPEKDPVTYEKPLPLDLMPYVERTDAYRSMGTAFAIGPNTFVTAGHVFVAGVNTQFGPPALRRADGTVFEVDQILKFSADEDFVVFSLRKGPSPAGLLPERRPQIDQPVLAVGNALGEGIVIRDGLFTSETPEQQDGRWKWIRFSAAASPGNSGGPLCDADGKVIGIVIGKSENENLNYSTPIGLVLDASPVNATFDQRLLASLPLTQDSGTHTMKDHFPLPLAWPAFVQAYNKVAEQNFDESTAILLAKNAASLFPKGEGSQDLLYDMQSEGKPPRLITQDSDGTWRSLEVDYHTTDLTQDGSISVGDHTAIKLLHLIRPAHASDDAFYRDSKGFMDLALKALDIRRAVGPDKVRVTSLGAAVSDTVFTDDYGRKWQERAWAIPYIDAFVVAVLLPTPEGYDGVLLLAPSSVQHQTHQTARWVAQHIDTQYSGTLSQWQAMLKRVDLLPKAMTGVKLTHRQTWLLETPRVTSSISTDLLALDERSLLTLGMAYVDEKPKVNWDIQSIRWELDDRRILGAEIRRSVRPPPTATLAIRNQFDGIAARRSPFDGNVIRETAERYSATRILDVPGKAAGKSAADLKYALTLRIDKFQPPPAMETKFAVLEQGTHILERSNGSDVAAEAPHAAGAQASIGDVAAAQQAAMSFSVDMKGFMGRDIRGREMSDDVRDYIQAYNKQHSANAAADSQNQEVQQGLEWLRRYWINYPALGHNRDMWTEFLSRNHLPANTPHSDQIVAMEFALLSSLSAGYPSESSAQRARDLLKGYIEERRIMIRTAPPPDDAALKRRQSPCPAPVAAIEGTHPPGVSSSSESLEKLWPAESKRLGEEGTVFIRVKVSAEGCAREMAIQASSGSDSLDSTVMRYVESISFRPASKDGKAFETSVTVPIVFKLTQ